MRLFSLSLSLRLSYANVTNIKSPLLPKTIISIKYSKIFDTTTVSCDHGLMATFQISEK